MTRVGAKQINAVAVEICEVCRWLHDRNLLAAADGNVSVRLADGRVLMTPSGVSKARLRPEEMTLLTLQGEVERGHPSSERGMHLAILTACPDAQAVVHAHPPTTIAWTVAHPQLSEFPGTVLPEVILGIGAIPIAPYARPGTDAVGIGLLPHLPHRRALVLARHGAVCWGESLYEAYDGIERVEHVAQILKTAHDLGGVTAMAPSEVAELTGVRATLGPRVR
jgi:L-fuculose-phosphate aldolase